MGFYGIDQFLVGGIPTPLNNMKVTWDDYSQYMGQEKNVPNHQPDINMGIKVINHPFAKGLNTNYLW